MISALITLVIYIAVLAILYALVMYLLKELAIGDPIARAIRIAMVVIFCLIIILLLLNLIGIGDVPLPRLNL